MSMSRFFSADDMHHSEAVRLWREGDQARKLFARECAMVSGRRTQALADDCRVSVDTIENHRNAYRLAYALDLETSDTNRIWEGVGIALWIAAAKKRETIPDETLRGYLSDALANGTTIEAFRLLLENHNRTKPEWSSRLKRIVRQLFKLRTDFKNEFPAAARERFENAVQAFEREMQEIAQMEVEA